MNVILNKNHKLIIAIALGLIAIIVVSAVIITILSPKKTPVSAEYITVTIDDSVSASFTLTNDQYTVTGADTYNKSDIYLVNTIGSPVSFTQAMDAFLKNLIDAKKLSGNGDEVLLFSVESRNEKDFKELSAYFKSVLKGNAPNCRIYTLYIKVKQDNVQELADKYNVSYAKAHLCMKLQKENRKLNAEELITLSVTEIVKHVNELGKEDLLDRIENEINEEQKNEQLPEDNTSDNTSSTVTSSDIVSSQPSSNETTSSEITSSEESSDNSYNGPSFSIEKDESGWTPLT